MTLAAEFSTEDSKPPRADSVVTVERALEDPSAAHSVKMNADFAKTCL